MATLHEAQDQSPMAKAKKHWKKLRQKTKEMLIISFMRKESLQHVRGREKGMRAMMDQLQKVELTPRGSPEEEKVRKRAKLVAISLFLGLLVDGVPEGILMGFLAAEGHLTPVFVFSLFVANFPEAFSSASLLITAKMSQKKIIGMWGGLCLLVGGLAGLSCWAIVSLYPKFVLGATLPLYVRLGACFVEGITGGAMIACIASVMLPEAFERCHKEGSVFASSGFLCTCGFLTAVMVKALGG